MSTPPIYQFPSTQRPTEALPLTGARFRGEIVGSR
jgi:hypothetical protein